jgi:fructose-bisphosphate aldolase class II
MLGGIEEDVVGVAEEDVHKFLTDPDEAERFVRETGCDSLAVAIGTSHGAYKFKHAPTLAFDRIDEIAQKVPGTPLVMHGSSSVPAELVGAINKYAVLDQGNAALCRTAGETNWEQMPKTMGVPEEAIARAAKMAVCKVNIDTDLRLALTASILKVWGKSNDTLWAWLRAGGKDKRPEFPFDPRKYLAPGREAVKAVVAGKMKALGCAGKAKAVMG